MASLKVVALQRLQSQLQRLRQELSEAHSRIEQLRLDSVDLIRLKGDQEDLLELLADQDAKLGNFKVRLRALGEKVDEDEDLDDETDTPNEDYIVQS